MTKCSGCGISLQTDNKEMPGFTVQKENHLCNRCFRLRHYNEYQKVLQENHNYISILEKINKTNDLVIFVVDLFLFHKTITDIRKYIQNDILLVLTKRDVLPKKIDDQKWISYFEKMPLSFVSIEVVSSLKNYHFDSLFAKINQYKKSNNVYVVGYTSAGKSTLINQIIYHYAKGGELLTTSMMPSTTLDMLPIEINESLTLIDTPGLLVPNSIIEFAEEKILKKIMPKKEIKPLTYQIKGKQYILIEDFLSIGVQDVNLTLYISNALQVKRVYKESTIYPYQKKIEVKKDEDLVIEGLGFITVTSETLFYITSKYNVNIYTRKKII